MLCSSPQRSVPAGVLASLATRPHGTFIICLASAEWLLLSSPLEHWLVPSSPRLWTAREALNDFESQGIELSGFCREVKRALSIVGF